MPDAWGAKRKGDFTTTARKRPVRKKPVFLAGESALVSEFGALCAAAGRPALYKLNSGERPLSRGPGLRQAAIPPRGALLAVELTNTDREAKRKNLRALDRALPREALLLSSSTTVTVTEQAGWIRHAGRLVGISALPTLLSGRLIELAPSPATTREAVSAARDIFSALGKEVSVVQDRIGMVMPRILCMLVNEAAFALMEETASPASIDAAMTLGTGYPLGPVEWAGKMGIGQVVSVLRALRDDLGEERYRIAPLLQQMVTAGVSPAT
jgi:3-hydroxybutyryl-CoA dehydrogenase